MRQDILETLNKQFDHYTSIFHLGHRQNLISDTELLQYLNEVSQVRTHLTEVLNKASEVHNA